MKRRPFFHQGALLAPPPEWTNCSPWKQSLRTQITNLGGTVAGGMCEGINGGGGGGGGRGGRGGGGEGGGVSEGERKSIEERLSKVEAEMEAKKVAVKNLKLTLDKIDITDNIDVRIRAAELEYELEREELNILNLKEEASLLSTRLQESCLPLPPPLAGDAPLSPTHKARVSFQELLSVPGNSSIVAGVSLVCASVTHTPGNPPFHVSFRAPFGCVIDWATDDTTLKKGDRIIEINGEIVLGKNIDDVTKIMSSSAHLALVVSRPMGESGTRKAEKAVEEKVKESKELGVKLDKALKERDTLKNDNTRLSHRISYLEDQVTELQSTLQKAKDAAIVTGSPNEVLTPSHPGATIIQVFQKGHQTLAVAGAEIENPDSRVQEYPTLPRLKSPSCSTSHDDSRSSNNMTIDEKEEDEVQPRHRPVDEATDPGMLHRTFDSIPPHSSSADKSTRQQQHQQGLKNCPTIRPRRSIDDCSDYQTINIKGKMESSNSTKLFQPPNNDYDIIEKLRDKLTEKSPSYSYKTPNDFAEESHNSAKSEDQSSIKSRRSIYESDQQSFSDSNYDHFPKQSGWRRESGESRESREQPGWRRENGESREQPGWRRENGESREQAGRRRENGENREPPGRRSENGESREQAGRRRESGGERMPPHSRPSSRERFLLGSPPPPARDGETLIRFSRGVHGCEAPFRRVVSPSTEERPLRPRPVPPKKPERLSLQRTTSMQSVEDARPSSRTSSVSTPAKSVSQKTGLLPTDAPFFTPEHQQTYNNNNNNNNNYKNNRHNSNNTHHNAKNSLYNNDEHRSPISRPASSASDDRYPTPSPRNLAHTNNILNNNNNNNNSRRTSLQNYRDSRRLTMSPSDPLPIYESPLARNSSESANGHHGTPNGHHMTSNGHNITPKGLNMAPKGPNMTPNGQNMTPNGPNMPPSGPPHPKPSPDPSSSSSSSSLFLDTSMGVDLHQDVRAQPLYDYFRRGNPEFPSTSPEFPSSTSPEFPSSTSPEFPSTSPDSPSTSSLSSSSLTSPSRRPPKPASLTFKEGFDAPPTPSTPPRGINLSMRNAGKEGEEWC